MTAAVNPQVWWWLARASGIVAWCMATASIVWGLTLSSKLVRRRKVPAWLLDLHKYLGTLTLAFVAVHLVALVADNYVDFGLRDLFVPMASAWRPGAVAWGIVALYLLLVVQVTSWLMRRMPRKVWHRIHMTSFAVFAAATVHGALAGADSGAPLVQFAAVAGTTIVVFLVFLRLLNVSGAVADDERPRDARVARSAAAPRTIPLERTGRDASPLAELPPPMFQRPLPPPEPARLSWTAGPRTGNPATGVPDAPEPEPEPRQERAPDPELAARLARLGSRVRTR